MTARLIASALAVVAWLAPVSGEDAVTSGISAMSEGRFFREFAVHEERVVGVRAGEKVPLASDARWALDGDIESYGQRIFLAAPYRILRTPGLPATSWKFATIQLMRHTAWSDAQLRDGVLLFVWVVDRQPRLFCAVMPDVESNDLTHPVAVAAFELDATTESGVPWVFLLKNGDVVNPDPVFRIPAANQVLQAMHLGTLDEVRERSAGLDLGETRDTFRNLPLLHLAAEAGFTGVVDELVAAGADPNQNVRPLGTVLHLAANTGRGDMARALLARGVRNRKRVWDRQPPFACALFNGHIDLAALLADRLKPDALANLRDLAVRQGDAAALETLVAKGHRQVVEALPSDTVRMSVESGDAGLLRVALQYGARPERPLLDALLLDAVGRGNVECMRLLLEAGAARDTISKSGYTPLMLAASRGDALITMALLEAGANATISNPQGRTPLHFAVLSGVPEAVEVLIARAEVNPPDHEGKTALDYALQTQCSAVMSLLCSAGARIDVNSPRAAEALTAAIIMDAAPVIERAIADGWNAGEPLHPGWPAAALARLHGATQTIEILAQAAEATPASTIVVENPEKSPRVVAPLNPPDARPRHLEAAVEVTVDGIVDETGKFRFARLLTSTDPRLAYSILQTVSHAPMEPAVHEGKPVASRLALDFNYAARPQRVFVSAADHRPASPRHALWAPLTHVEEEGLYRPPAFAYTNVPGDPRNTTLTTDYVVPRTRILEGHAFYPGWAVAAVTVAPDGRAERVQVIDASDEAFAVSTMSVVSEHSFIPGSRHGEAVRSRIVVTVASRQVP